VPNGKDGVSPATRSSGHAADGEVACSSAERLRAR